MKQETVEQSASPAKDAEASRLRVILAVVIAAVFLDVVDFSVIQVALPTIQHEFGAPLASAQWIIGVYGLTLAGFLMVSGRAGDVYGQKRVFVVGIVGFTLSSLTAGFAPSLLVLIVARPLGARGRGGQRQGDGCEHGKETPGGGHQVGRVVQAVDGPAQRPTR